MTVQTWRMTYSSFDSRDIRYISSSIRVHSLKYP